MPSDFENLIRAGALQNGAGVRRPTNTELAELERVQGMQIRTNAANVAAIRFQGLPVDDDSVLSLARKIADFIAEG